MSTRLNSAAMANELRFIASDDRQRDADGMPAHRVTMTIALDNAAVEIDRLTSQRAAVLALCDMWERAYDCYDDDDIAMQDAVKDLRKVFGVTA